MELVSSFKLTSYDVDMFVEYALKRKLKWSGFISNINREDLIHICGYRTIVIHLFSDNTCTWEDYEDLNNKERKKVTHFRGKN